MTQFNIEEAEFKMLNYLVQSQAAEKYYKHKQAVKEHKDIHKLVVSKMFDIKYEAVTEEQRRFAKTVDFEYLYKAGLI